MTKELYDKVVAYRISMSVIKSMLKSNIITARENGLSSCSIFDSVLGVAGFTIVYGNHPVAVIDNPFVSYLEGRML